MTDTADNSFLHLDQQLCFSLYSASNAITRAYRPLLKEIDLTYPQYLVMMVIWNQTGLQLKELSQQLHLDSGTLTPLVKRLEAKGLLIRRSHASDERAKQIFLTKAGEQLRQNAEHIPMAIYEKFGFTEEAWFAFKKTCDQLNTFLLEQEQQ